MDQHAESAIKATRTCPPCSGTCFQGRECPARGFVTLRDQPEPADENPAGFEWIAKLMNGARWFGAAFALALVLSFSAGLFLGH